MTTLEIPISREILITQIGDNRAFIILNHLHRHKRSLLQFPLCYEAIFSWEGLKCFLRSYRDLPYYVLVYVVTCGYEICSDDMMHMA
jgi:hypothetical protein